MGWACLQPAARAPRLHERLHRRVTDYLQVQPLLQHALPAQAVCCALHPTGIMLAVAFEDQVVVYFVTTCAPASLAGFMLQPPRLLD